MKKYLKKMEIFIGLIEGRKGHIGQELLKQLIYQIKKIKNNSH